MKLAGDLFTYLREFAPILFGLAAGAIAHVGMMWMNDDRPTFKHIVGFTMQLGVIGLLASVATRMLGMTDDDTRALTSAILAISAQEVVRYLKREGWGPFARAVIPGRHGEKEGEQ